MDPRFIDTHNRPTLAQTFQQDGTPDRLTVVVNHLKSKGSACAGDPDTGDGRTGKLLEHLVPAAERLVAWLATGRPDGQR